MENDFLKVLSDEEKEKVRKAPDVAMQRVKNGVPFALALFDSEIIKAITDKTESEDD